VPFQIGKCSLKDTRLQCWKPWFKS